MSERTIDLDKVLAAVEKIQANPGMLDGLNAEITKLFDGLGMDLNGAEKQTVLTEMVQKSENRLNVGCGGGCANL